MRICAYILSAALITACSDSISPTGAGKTRASGIYHSVENDFGEVVLFICRDQKLTASIAVDGRIRTRAGKYIFVKADDKPPWHSRRLQIYENLNGRVHASGDGIGAVAISFSAEDAAQLFDFAAKGDWLRFEIDERNGYLIETNFRLHSADKLDLQVVTAACGVRDQFFDPSPAAGSTD